MLPIAISASDRPKKSFLSYLNLCSSGAAVATSETDSTTILSIETNSYTRTGLYVSINSHENAIRNAKSFIVKEKGSLAFSTEIPNNKL